MRQRGPGQVRPHRPHPDLLVRCQAVARLRQAGDPAPQRQGGEVPTVQLRLHPVDDLRAQIIDHPLLKSDLQLLLEQHARPGGQIVLIEDRGPRGDREGTPFLPLTSDSHASANGARRGRLPEQTGVFLVDLRRPLSQAGISSWREAAASRPITSDAHPATSTTKNPSARTRMVPGGKPPAMMAPGMFATVAFGG